MKRPPWYLLWCLLFCACGSVTGPPELSETVQDEPKTGSITIIVCMDGVCPDGTILGDVYIRRIPNDTATTAGRLKGKG